MDFITQRQLFQVDIIMGTPLLKRYLSWLTYKNRDLGVLSKWNNCFPSVDDRDDNDDDDDNDKRDDHPNDDARELLWLFGPHHLLPLEIWRRCYDDDDDDDADDDDYNDRDNDDAGVLLHTEAIPDICNNHHNRWLCKKNQ